MAVLPSSCLACRRWPLSSHYSVRIFDHAGHGSLLLWSSRCRHLGGRRLLHFSKMADATALVVFRVVAFARWPPSSLQPVAVTSLLQDSDAAPLVVFRDVITNWQRGLRLLASSLCPNIGHGERVLCCLETALSCSGDLPDSIGTTSPKI